MQSYNCIVSLKVGINFRMFVQVVCSHGICNKHEMQKSMFVSTIVDKFHPTMFSDVDILSRYYVTKCIKDMNTNNTSFLNKAAIFVSPRGIGYKG